MNGLQRMAWVCRCWYGGVRYAFTFTSISNTHLNGANFGWLVCWTKQGQILDVVVFWIISEISGRFYHLNTEIAKFQFWDVSVILVPRICFVIVLSRYLHCTLLYQCCANLYSSFGLKVGILRTLVTKIATCELTYKPVCLRVNASQIVCIS